MSQKKVFKTAEKAVEYLFSEELESEMIALPPKVDEGFDDSETLSPSVREVELEFLYLMKTMMITERKI
ncbi:hypothetical protein TNCV_2498091 [Trichonephila clavipes]|nr:hypothetical protein TNCV_2498091 [Trichonephila clavipes]